MIRFEHVKKRYGKDIILNDISFEIDDGEFVVLIGPSGCGKTTTLKAINRLIDVDEGHIFIDGRDTAREDKVKLRRSIGYVIQQIGLFPNMTVAQNICVVPKLLGYGKEQCDTITRDLLAMVNMPYEKYAGQYPCELSGGQQQRIGVLRALAASPPIVLMDEPFGALDPVTRGVLQEEVKKLQKKLNKTIIFVTHDMDEALNLADRIIFMEHGEIAQMATPEEMLENPADDLIRSFMGKRAAGSDAPDMTAADFMRANVTSVYTNKKIRECTEMMARHKVDTLLLMNPDNTYAGTISINSIKSCKKSTATAGELLSTENCCCDASTDAKECFDLLLSSGDSYMVVLNADKTIAGIVTKTSMARAMAEALWGDTP
ncbi:MAG: betaine/proline/choline family ABC transporter ATP-binding protein [Angelakisella sp.]